MTLVTLFTIILGIISAAAGFIEAGFFILFFVAVCVVGILMSPFMEQMSDGEFLTCAAETTIFLFIAVLVVCFIRGILMVFRSAQTYAAARKFARLEESVAQRAASLWNRCEAGTRRVLTIAGKDFALRYCPSGACATGSSDDEEGRHKNEAQSEVVIEEGFWICETPTTQAQWKALGGRKSKRCKFKGDNLPVEKVAWKRARAYVKRLNRLGVAPEGWRFDFPTEEQWEYACRAETSGSTYGATLDESAWYEANSENKTHEVGAKKPNAWGVYDMLGGVWELTKNKRGNWLGTAIARGGSWRDDAQNCRPASRRKFSRASVRSNLGFRLVLVRSESR